jgi:coenzyme F420-reducing hydrogenase delta subunit
MAQVPPAFIDYVLSRDLADGVLMTGCPGGDCRYRLGAQWMSERVARVRDPRLRTRVVTSRIALGWEQPWSDHSDLSDMLGAFRETLDEREEETLKVKGAGWQGYAKGLAMGVALGLFALACWRLSSWPRFQLLEADEAMISLTFARAGQRLQECRTLTQDELDKLPPNMRNPQDCPRERHVVEVEFRSDGEILYEATLPPSGIWNDGESTIYKRIIVTAGVHTLFVGMRDSGRREGFDIEHEATVMLDPSQHWLVEFDHNASAFVFEQAQ